MLSSSLSVPPFPLTVALRPTSAHEFAHRKCQGSVRAPRPRNICLSSQSSGSMLPPRSRSLEVSPVPALLRFQVGLPLLLRGILRWRAALRRQPRRRGDRQRHHCTNAHYRHCDFRQRRGRARPRRGWEQQPPARGRARTGSNPESKARAESTSTPGAGSDRPCCALPVQLA